MRVTFLGTGDAGGVPLYGCDCAACARARQDDTCRRRNCSALIESGDVRILLDAGLTDLTERFPPGSLSAIVLTHFHPDHVQGLFHLRWGKGVPITVYAPPDEEGCADLFKHPGLLDFRTLDAFAPITIGHLRITGLPLNHSRPTFGYAIEDAAGKRFAYLTDTVGLPPATAAFLQAWRADAIVLDCSHPPREPAPRNHNDYRLALEVIAQTGPGQAWLTHLGHEFDCWRMQGHEAMPAGIALAHDGAVICL